MRNKNLQTRKPGKFKELHGKCNYTYLTGLYMVLNSMQDSFLMLDAPKCGYDKIFCIERTHDLFSNIFSRDSKHRLRCSGISPREFVYDRTEELMNMLAQIAREEICAGVFFCSMPIAAIQGIDYHQIVKNVQLNCGKPIIEIPPKSLNSDWLEGYAQTLLSVAKTIDIKCSSKEEKNIAIVGYLFHRNEGDNTGDIQELKRIFKELSLNLVSVWLSGSSFTSLKKIEKAETIISLPYAREAAKEIAKKTGARLINLDLPIGIKKTEEFILQVAKNTNVLSEAENFIKKELDEIIPVISRLVPKYFQGKVFSVNGDPYFCEAVSQLIFQLGGELRNNIIFSSKKKDEGFLPMQLFYEPRYGDVYNMDFSGVDMVIGNSHIKYILKIKGVEKGYVEIGYPSQNYHCLTTSPYLGFRGTVNMINRIINRYEDRL